MSMGAKPLMLEFVSTVFDARRNFCIKAIVLFSCVNRYISNSTNPANRKY